MLSTNARFQEVMYFNSDCSMYKLMFSGQTCRMSKGQESQKNGTTLQCTGCIKKGNRILERFRAPNILSTQIILSQFERQAFLPFECHHYSKVRTKIEQIRIK